MTDEAEPTWRRWLTNPWAWPLPAVLLHALVLLGSGRVWTERVPMARGGSHVPAHGQLALLLVVGLVYALAQLAPDALMSGGGSWRMREPTDAERGCVLVLLKAFCLLALYGSAYAYASRYLGGGS